MWEKDTSESLLKKNGIDLKKAYVMNPEQKLAAATPTVYITDKDGTVVFNSTEINLSIEKLIDLGYVDRVHIPQELRIRSRGTERHSASN